MEGRSTGSDRWISDAPRTHSFTPLLQAVHLSTNTLNRKCEKQTRKSK